MWSPPRNKKQEKAEETLRHKEQKKFKEGRRSGNFIKGEMGERLMPSVLKTEVSQK
jgi:hypothetical protein